MMPNRIPRKSAAHTVVRIVVTLGVLLLAAFLWQQLWEPIPLTSGALEPVQYGHFVYSGEDIWHAFPFGR